MAQVTGRKVATTPIVPTPSGGGNVINSWNTSDNKETNAPSMKIVKDDLDAINDNLNGFKFYPTGTDIVGLIADDSAYTDEDGNYVVWGTATANQLVEDNPNTYKSVPSEEETHGEVGADSASPFSTNKELVGEVLYKGGGSDSHGYAFSFTVNFTKDYKIVALYTVCNSSWDNGTITLSRGTYNQLFKGNQSSRVMNIGYINDVKSGDSLSFSEGGYAGYGTVIGFLES